MDSNQANAALQRLMNVYYDGAKHWKILGITLKLLLFGGSVAAIFIPRFELGFPAAALIIALLEFWMKEKASKCKSVAEYLKRQYEFWEGWGDPPSEHRLADIRVATRDDLTVEEHELLNRGTAFASVQPKGTRRVLGNLAESAWFSKHEADWCAQKLLFVLITAVVLGVLLLLTAAHSFDALPARFAASKAVGLIFVGLVSIGILESYQAYSDFARKAGEIESEAQRLLSSGCDDRPAVQRLLSDYQLARAGAPSIPTWVWKLRRDDLNDNWKTLKQQPKD